MPNRRVDFWGYVAPMMDDCGCWEWFGPRNVKGYGCFGKSAKAHRASYEMHVGPIPVGLLVCHKCDNPSCVNPSHLFLGTQLDNAQDRDRKGRRTALSLERHGRAVLTDEIVREIRGMKNYHGLVAGLARKYGVSFSTVQSARRGETWKGLSS